MALDNSGWTARSRSLGEPGKVSERALPGHRLEFAAADTRLLTLRQTEIDTVSATGR